MGLLEPYWPAGARGSIIITSQNQSLTQPPISASFVLESFTEEEGTTFLLENIDQSAQNVARPSEDASDICRACGGLPLALSQVVRYIRSVNMSLEDARKLCSTAESIVSVDSELNQLSQPDYYHQLGISELWERTLQWLDKGTAYLSQVFAHLDPDTIPEKFVKSSSNPEVRRLFGTATELVSHFISLFIPQNIVVLDFVSPVNTDPG